MSHSSATRLPLAPAEVLSREKCFTSRKFTIERRQLRLHNGHEVQRDVVIHPGAVVILPLLDPQHIVMIRNARPAIGQVLLELPAGTREPGEEPAVTAARELIEETGYRAEAIEPLGSFFTSPGILSERMHAYLARDLRHVGLDLEEDEAIEPHVVPLADALAMCADGRIEDGKTMACLMAFVCRYGRVR